MTRAGQKAALAVSAVVSVWMVTGLHQKGGSGAEKGSSSLSMFKNDDCFG